MNHRLNPIYSVHAFPREATAGQGRGLGTEPVFRPAQHTSLYFLCVSQRGDRKCAVDASLFKTLSKAEDRKPSRVAAKETS